MYACSAMYGQTDSQIARLSRAVRGITQAGEKGRKMGEIPLSLRSLYARKLVVGPFIPKFPCKYRAHSQLSVAAVCGRGGSVCLARRKHAALVRVRSCIRIYVHLFTVAQPRLAISKGYSSTERNRPSHYPCAG